MDQDRRWTQHFSNYVKALDKLRQSVEYINHHFINKDDELIEDEGNVLDEMIKEGLIQRFEYTTRISLERNERLCSISGQF